MKGRVGAVSGSFQTIHLVSSSVRAWTPNSPLSCVASESAELGVGTKEPAKVPAGRCAMATRARKAGAVEAAEREAEAHEILEVPAPATALCGAGRILQQLGHAAHHDRRIPHPGTTVRSEERRVGKASIKTSKY